LTLIRDAGMAGKVEPPGWHARDQSADSAQISRTKKAKPA
jgi:hypothetical protein